MFTHKTLDKHTKNERVPAEQFSNKPSKPERKKKEFSIHPKSCDPFRIFIFKIKEKRWLTQINHIGAMRELYQGILIIIIILKRRIHRRLFGVKLVFLILDIFLSGR
jgi:hypothetical protein